MDNSKRIATPDVVAKVVGKLRWRVRPDLLPAGLETLLEDPDSFLRAPARLLADSALVTMGVVASPGNNPRQLLLRRLNYGRPRHRLRDVFRASRVERAFKHGLAMELAGVPTPQVVAVGVERFTRWPVRAYLLTEFVPDAKMLRDLMAAQERMSAKQIRQLASMMARLHASGFSHRDLNSTNILYNKNLEPCFIDLDGVRHYDGLSWNRTIKDLARLAEEFIAKGLEKSAPWFLKHYCHERGMNAKLRLIHGTVARKLKPVIAARRK